MKKKKVERVRLTDHFTYQIDNNVIYIFQEEESIPKDELLIVFKKISLLIDDENISYINISSKNIEKRKAFYQDLGFSLSYYSIDKLNKLYEDYPNKKAYRCYAFMTKNDFLNINKEEKPTSVDKEEKREEINTSNSDKGFISNILILSGGLILLCYLCIEWAISLIK